MGINTHQFKTIIVQPALKAVDLYSVNAEKLILGTCAIESDFGHYLLQVGGGPAVGIFQMEPATFDDIISRYLERADKSALKQKVYQACSLNEKPAIHRLSWDLRLATILARVKYVMDFMPIPSDLREMGEYYKRIYNSSKGAGTVEKFLEKYKYYVEDHVAPLS